MAATTGTTKERILETAVNLFAERGFNDVSVREITGAVGIKESSLYNHFSSKEKILEAIFEHLRQKLESTTVPEDEAVRMMENMSPEEFTTFSARIFKEYLGDPVLMKIWKILSIERFRNASARDFFRINLIDNALAYHEKVFDIMMRKGVIRESDPKILAREFYAHTIFLYFRYFEVGQDLNFADNPDVQRMVMEHVEFMSHIMKKYGQDAV